MKGAANVEPDAMLTFGLFQLKVLYSSACQKHYVSHLRWILLTFFLLKYLSKTKTFRIQKELQLEGKNVSWNL